MEVFKKVPVFKGLKDDELYQILALAEKRTFKPEERIFSEGDDGDGFYVILKGEVRISMLLDGIGEELLMLLKSNDYFGEMSLIDDQPRSANAISDKETTCMFIERKKFRDFLHGDIYIENKIMSAFLKEFSHRLRNTDIKMKNILLLMKSF